MKKGDTYYMMYSANYYKGKNYASAMQRQKVRSARLSNRTIILCYKRTWSREASLPVRGITA